MTESDTTRFGLRQWSAGTDTPARTEFNQSFANLEDRSLLSKSDIAANRPAANAFVRGLYSASDTFAISYSDGSSWRTLATLTDTQTLTNKTFDSSSPSVFLPPGMGPIPWSGGGTPPAGWLICDGSAVSRATYAALFAVYNAIGLPYGAGNGTTTFNLPDMRGKVPAGYNSSEAEFNAYGKTGGEKSHVLTIPEMPAHDHGGATGSGGDHSHTGTTASAGSHDHDLSVRKNDSYDGSGNSSVITGVAGYNPSGAAGGNVTGTGTTQSGGAHTHGFTTSTTGAHTHTVAAQGGGAAHNNLQPYNTFAYIVKF